MLTALRTATLLSSVPSSLAPETRALLARMTVQPDSYDRAAYDEAIVALKAAALWDKLDAFYCFGSHDQQASTLNWKGSTYDATIGGAVTHTPYFGFLSNGSTGRLDTSYLFAPGRQNDGHIGVLIDSDGASSSADCGNTNSNILARQTSTDKAFFRVNGAAASEYGQTSGVSTRSHFCASRTASGSENFYVCGELAIAGAASATPEATYPIWFCGRNSASPAYSAKRQMIGHIGKGLITAEVATLEAICVRLTARLQSRPALGTGYAKLNMLLSFMRSNTYRRKYLFGALRRAYQWGATTPDIWDDTFAIGAKYPGLMMVEWHPPQMPGSLYVQQKAEIVAHYEAGGVVTVHHHAGNPLTGSFYSVPAASGAGSQYDTAAGTVGSCLAAGSRRTQFLDYCDTWAAFLNGLVASDGSKVPVIIRPFHEINGDWFWWNATGTDAGIKQMYKDFVDRLRAQGVTNALFSFCQATGVDQNYALLSARYPGDDYIDILGISAYDEGVTSTGLTLFNSYYSGGQAIGAKPLMYSELGFTDVSASDMTLWNTKVGTVLQNAHRGMAGVAIWREPFGYKDGAANESDVAALLASSRCLTLDRLSGVYS